MKKIYDSKTILVKFIIILSIFIQIGCNTEKKSNEVFISGDLIIFDKKPYNGLLVENYENGNTKFKCNIVEGLIQGNYIEFYENGKIKREGIYKNNLFFPKQIKTGNGLIDIENKKYSTAIIGNQEWMTENLSVSHFNNGDPIFYAKTDKEWAVSILEKRPAYCYVEDDELDPNNYGKLYNYYAVIDSRGLAPKNWKIPDKSEWDTLRDYTGNDLFSKLNSFLKNDFNGDILKSSNGWYSNGYNLNGNNYTGFNAKPNGWVKFDEWQDLEKKYYKKDFSEQNEISRWWINSNKTLYSSIVGYGGSYLNTNNEIIPLDFGLAVRCINKNKK